MRYSKITHSLLLDSNASLKKEFNVCYISHISEAAGKNKMHFTNCRKFVGLYFNLGTDLRYTVGKLPSDSIVTNGFNLIYINSGMPCDFQWNGNLKLMSFRFTPSFLKLYAESFPILNDFLKWDSGKNFAKLTGQHAQVTARIWRIVHDIIYNRYPGKLRDGFIAAKVFDLLGLCFTEFTNQNNANNSRHNNSIKRKMEKIKKNLIENIMNPLPIPDLAYQTGININKLESSFKECYGQTLYEFIHAERMNKAKLLLTDTEITIRKISEMFGYKNHSNFSEAFRKKFGISPNGYRNELKKKSLENHLE